MTAPAMPPITLIVAVAENGVIGAAGGMPWHLPEDLKRFKALTLGKPVLMGRKTWESLPKKPLPGRTNIVVTRDAGFRADGALVAHSIEDGLTLAAREQPTEIMVIGGAAIFAEVLPRASRIHWTQIMTRPKGDAFMPPLDTKQWRETQSEGPFESASDPGGLRYAYIVLERVQR
jgi:dihydrofolate reductase